MKTPRITRAATLALAAGLALTGFAARAHHSFGMFDPAKVVTVDGTVKAFDWTNPHVVIHILAKAPAGAATEWTVELTSPGNLTRSGWTRTTLKPGDQAEVTFHPLRNGQHGGGFLRLKTASGQIMGGGAPGGPQQGVS